VNVQLALYKGKGNIGNAGIRWWTASVYSHCELVVDGWCYSSSVRDNGVRRKRINLDSGKWDLMTLPWANSVDIEHYFAATDPNRYGWASLITSQLFNRNSPVKGVQFCSEWCAAAAGIPNASSYSPGSLAKLCEWLNRTPNNSSF